VCPIFTLAHVPPPLRYPPISIRKPPVVSSFRSTAADGGCFPYGETTDRRLNDDRTSTERRPKNDRGQARVSVSDEAAVAVGEALEVWIDQDLCTGDGICVQYAPEVFELDIDGLAYVKGDDDELRQSPRATVPVPLPLLRDVADSAKECPGECIHVLRPADDVEIAGPGAE
jgi:ferredoxin